MPDLVPVRRALLSVSDKSGLVPFAQALAARGCELVSTGGTARALEGAGLRVTPVERLTGFPEMMDGRVKTLHPKVHGGLLALRDNPEHVRSMREHGIEPIDLVCINLYPFQQTVLRSGVTREEAIENIDIGGPSMIRSAAKNAEHVAVVTSPAQYAQVAAALEEHGGALPRELRRELAVAAFATTAAYDAAIMVYLDREGRAEGGVGPSAEAETEDASVLLPVLPLQLERRARMRYGENPHQPAALYRDPSSASPCTLVGAEQLHGKELGFNNLLDASAALELVKMLHRLNPARPAACVVKHTNPCGAASAGGAGGRLRQAVDAAIAGDPLAAYGGILAVTRAVDAEAAAAIADPSRFFEVVVAPAFEPEALALLRERSRNIRLLAVGEIPDDDTEEDPLDLRSIPGGMLVQHRDLRLPEPASWTHAAGPEPTREQLNAAAVLEAIGRALSSNAVCIGGADPAAGETIRLFGAGAGQMDRVASSELAVRKAGALAQGAVAYSDAFFPFPDGPRILIDAGVTVLVHPGGSKRDQETFDLCNERGVTCVVTGVRRFRH